MKRHEKLLLLADHIRYRGTCTDVELIKDFVPRPFLSEFELRLLLEELSYTGEVIECRYVADIDRQSIRSIFFPTTTRISLFNWKQGIYGETNGPHQR